MNPYYFGDSKRRLFGIFHPATSRQSLNTCVLLCYPVGQEYIRAHRAFLQLSLMLSRAGFHVLRFDYFATGDSAGESGEGTIEQWKDDIHIAVDELQAMSGVSRISIVGLRLGAALAAAAAEGMKVADLVLWDPVVSGEKYLDELRTIHRELLNRSNQSPILRERTREEEAGELVGFPFPPGMSEGIEHIDLLHTRERIAARTLLVVSQERHDYIQLQKRFSTINSPLDYRVVPGDPGWDNYQDHDSALMPYELLQTITAELARVAI